MADHQIFVHFGPQESRLFPHLSILAEKLKPMMARRLTISNALSHAPSNSPSLPVTTSRFHAFQLPNYSFSKRRFSSMSSTSSSAVKAAADLRFDTDVSSDIASDFTAAPGCKFVVIHDFLIFSWCCCGLVVFI